jgi:hypothetical protein
VVGRLLDTAGITPAPRGVTAAHTRRTSTDQQLTTRAAELGFASLQDYPGGPGGDPAMANHQHRQRASGAPGHGA